MLYGLASVIAYIGDYSVTVFKLEKSSNFGNSLKYFCNSRRVVSAYTVARRNMSLGYNEAVNRCLRINIKEGVASLILIYLARGNIPLDNRTE